MNSQNLWFSQKENEKKHDENRMCSTLRNGKQPCLLLFMLVIYYSRICVVEQLCNISLMLIKWFLKFTGHKIEFSKYVILTKITEILPKIIVHFL